MTETELRTLFPDVADAPLADAAARFYVIEVGRGVVIIEEGEQDAALLFILEGQVAIRTGDYEVGNARAGGLVGEVGLFGGALRIASVHALRPCAFAVLDISDYSAMRDAGNPVAYAVEKLALKQLAGRLREADQRVAEMSHEKAPIADGPEQPGAPVDSYVDALAILQKSRLFDDAPIGALDDVANRMQARRFATGEILCRQGSRGDDLYILAEGEVTVVITAEDGRGENVATLSAGDVFGMASLLQDRPRIASCVAKAPVLALRMERAQCLDLVLADNRAGSVLRTAMIRALSDQLAYANAQFAQLSLARRQKTSELLARLGIEAHGKHMAVAR